jgi:hypothetical protein
LIANSTPRCASGHVNPPTVNIRCSKCERGWAASTDGRGRCQKCENSDASVAILALVLTAGLVFVVVMVAFRMRSSGRRKAAHSTLKRTILTHLQMVSIVISLNVPWPNAVRTFFVGMTSTISGIDNSQTTLHCSTNTAHTAASVFFGIFVASVALPFLTVGASSIYWFLCVPQCPVLGCAKKPLRQSKCFEIGNPFTLPSHFEIRRKPFTLQESQAQDGKRSARDGWVFTNVLFIYLTFPSVVRMSLKVFQCQEICGDLFLTVDDRERCYSSRHTIFVVAVGVPSLLIYLLLLPILTLIYLWFKRSILSTDRKLVFRFGLLFSGYAEDRWYWEIIVVGRKVLMLIIVTFAEDNLNQLHFALGLLVAVLFAQQRGKPFEQKGAVDANRQKNQCLHSMEITSLVVLTLMVWVAVFFKLGGSARGGHNNHSDSFVGLSFVVIASNMVFLLSCGFTLVKYYGHEKKMDQGFQRAIELVMGSFRASSQANVLDDVDNDARGQMNLNPFYRGEDDAQAQANPFNRGEVKKGEEEKNESTNTNKAKNKNKNQNKNQNKNHNKNKNTNKNKNKNKNMKKNKNKNTNKNKNKNKAQQMEAIAKSKDPAAASEIHTDAVSGRRYSYYPATGKTEWLPVEAPAPALAPVPEPQPDTPDIQIHTDPDSGARYSWNSKTKETTWLGASE